MKEIDIVGQELLKQYFKKDDIVIVAPLNWGLGHATRCIPLIHWLSNFCSKVIIASDGTALDLLRTEFPTLDYEALPTYGIEYKHQNMLINILRSFPTMTTAVIKEKRVAHLISKKYNATAILSDNRLGFRSENIRNYYLTHQINLLHSNSNIATMGTTLHQWFIRKFDMCFVPDFSLPNAIAPWLSHNIKVKTEYFGPLTRIGSLNLTKEIDICVLLSGPEPQRSVLESLLTPILNTLQTYKICMVRGTNTISQCVPTENHIVIKNLTNSEGVEQILNSSRLLIARSGYSTIMDIYHLDIQAILIPTPGQTEQEYLAAAIEHKSTFIKINQNELKKLPEIISFIFKS